MNRDFRPVLEGAQIRGTGMKHPRVPRVIVGSELNGYMQGDLMDANAISEYIDERIGDDPQSGAIHTELRNKIADLEAEDTRTASEIEEIKEDISNLGQMGEQIQGLQDLGNRVTNIETTINNIHQGSDGPTIDQTPEGDLIVVFS